MFDILGSFGDFARCDGRPRLRALDGRHLFQKVDENFSQKSFLLVLMLCLCRSLGDWFLLVFRTDGKNSSRKQLGATTPSAP